MFECATSRMHDQHAAWPTADQADLSDIKHTTRNLYVCEWRRMRASAVCKAWRNVVLQAGSGLFEVVALPKSLYSFEGTHSLMRWAARIAPEVRQVLLRKSAALMVRLTDSVCVFSSNFVATWSFRAGLY